MTPTNPVRVILLRYHSCKNLPRNNGILTHYKLLNLAFIYEYLRYPPRAVPHVHTKCTPNTKILEKHWKSMQTLLNLDICLCSSKYKKGGLTLINTLYKT